MKNARRYLVLTHAPRAFAVNSILIDILMLFEHGVCLGDSLTTGARSRYGVAESLSEQLNRATNKRWLFRCEATNGETVLQQLRRLDQKPWLWKDATFCSLIIGTNDAKSSVDTPPEIFQMLYGQILDRLAVAKVMLFPASIPDLLSGASLASPYDSKCMERIRRFNEVINSECKCRGLSDVMVDLTGLGADCFVDGVHFSEAGIDQVAKRFAEKIIRR
ncbi:MAG TPA: SGNH/GDSL hydrolase family protein [Lacunisphaera sp.]